jgi:hypothetical protein
MNFGEIAIRVQGSAANGPSAALYAEVTVRNERMVENSLYWSDLNLVPDVRPAAWRLHHDHSDLLHGVIVLSE